MNESRSCDPITETLELYYSECELIKQLRPATMKSYRDLFSGFLSRMPEIKRVGDLTPQSLSTFYKRISERREGGVKGSTIRTYHDKILVFFRWLESNEYIPRRTLVGKTLKPPRPRYEDAKALSPEEVSKIISSISVNGVNNMFQYRRDMTIIELLLYTGIRKGELLGIKVSDIDWVERTIHISYLTSKSRRSRTLPIHSTLFQCLKSYVTELKRLRVNSEYLIVSQRSYAPLTDGGLKHWVERYNKLSGVKFHLHQFRHTFACRLAMKHTDITSIKRLLGHTNSTMTERYLRSITPESARDYLERLSF